MSFIVSRDVCELTDDELERLGEVYDEIEQQYLDDWARDEYGPGWTHEDAIKENGGKWVGPMSVGGFDMLVYMYARMKEAESRAYQD